MGVVPGTPFFLEQSHRHLVDWALVGLVRVVRVVLCLGRWLCWWFKEWFVFDDLYVVYGFFYCLEDYSEFVTAHGDGYFSALRRVFELG